MATRTVRSGGVPVRGVETHPAVPAPEDLDSHAEPFVARIGAAMAVGPERMLSDIVNDVLSSKTKGE